MTMKLTDADQALLELELERYRRVPSGCELYMEYVNTMSEEDLQRHIEWLRKQSRKRY